jgi:HEAT repeat protein
MALASVNGTGSASGMGTVPGGDKPPSKSADTPIVETVEDEKLKSIEKKKSAALPVPDSIAKDFESPYARIRLQALDYWATQGIKAPLDPLLEALEDDDEDVRAKAAKIAEEQWGIKQELD